MHVDITDTKPKQSMLIDEMQHFAVRGDGRLRNDAQCIQN